MKNSERGYTSWEELWAPYDQATYQAVLAEIHPGDTVIDIGAGDLRLSRQIAAIAKQVYAIEIQAAVIGLGSGREPSRDEASRSEASLPDNLTIIIGDARWVPFPSATTGVLLMRHCTHFRLYAGKLKAAGADRLITNARWRLGTEVVHLNATREEYDQIDIGWFACWCGATGFKDGPVERLTYEVESSIHEVMTCPECGYS